MGSIWSRPDQHSRYNAADLSLEWGLDLGRAEETWVAEPAARWFFAAAQ